jgi:flavin reductase (DIM6/NTAB) family NADH-FMN oxidoreductase RutF
MEIDPAAHSGSIYHLLTSTIIPRPIGWASTLSAGGVPNLAPFSFFNALSGEPPYLMLSIGRRGGDAKDTLANILATKEFVVNIVGEHVAAHMNLTSGNYAPDVDEFAVSGLTRAPSRKVKAPRVAEAQVTLECVLAQAVPLPRSEYTLVIGEVVQFHIADDILDERGRVDPVKLAPIARLGGSSWYTTLGRVFEIQRPP